MLPNFVIIGAQKSASTFLQVCLSEHPEVFMPPDEIPFFESPDYERSNISELESLFNDRIENTFGIKRPNYIGKPEVPKRIELHLPHAKLIAVLRNPIDRAISAYFHYINYGFIPCIDLEKGMRQLIDQPSYGEKYGRSHEIIEFGLYFKYLKKYGYFLKSGRLLVLLHEEILRNPLESIQKAYRFLNIDPGFIPISLNSRPQSVIYNLPRLKLLRMRNKFSYNYNFDRTRLYKKQLDFFGIVIVRIITSIDRVMLAKILKNRKPKASLELRKILNQRYENDIRGLEFLICKDLSEWRVISCNKL
jgi:hypothetical protein